MRNCRFRLGSREHFTDVGTLRKLLNLAITIIADGHTLIVRQIYCPFDLQPIGTCYTNTKTPTNTTVDGRYIQHPMTCDARVNVLAFQVRSNFKISQYTYNIKKSTDFIDVFYFSLMRGLN